MSRLLDESWIEGLPDAVVENLEELNRYVVNRVCERIRKIGDIGAADAHRLKSVMEYAAGDMQAIEKEIARIMQKNVRDIDAIFEKAAAENIDFANAFFAARGTAPLKSYAQIAALDSLVRSVKAQAMDGLTNISNTHMIGFKDKTGFKPLRESYIRAIDRAIYFVQTGAVDYNTAIRETVRDMARSGLRVTFESGYSRRLDSQARMNILEGVRRLNGEMMRETGRRFEADGVEISAHALCAPDHLDIQGRQYRQADWDRINGGLQRPIGTLNCHHFATPIIYGVSRPVYSEKELAEINRRSTETVEWKGREMTRYEASQQQRRLETKIRYAKDEREALKAAGDTIGARQAGKKSAALQREYKAFCEKTGLTPRYERTRSMTGPTIAGRGKSAGGGTGSGGFFGGGRVVQVGSLNFMNKKAILAQLYAVQQKAEGLKYEINCTVTADGRVWLVRGDAGRVDPSAIPAGLAGSYAYHNHPKEKTNFSFSADDVRFFFESGEVYSKASDYLYEYVMERTPETIAVSPDWVYHRFKEIEDTKVLEMKWKELIDPDVDGFHEVMKILSKELNFSYERKKKD